MKYLKGVSYLLLGMLIFVACKEKAKEKVYVRSVKVFKASAHANQNNATIVPASINEKRETKLAFRVNGPLIKLNDIIGDYVQKGQVIAKIDPRDYKIAVESTQAAYKLASAEYKRYKTLLEKESVSASTYDQMESNYTAAKTAYESAKNALEDTDLTAPFSGYISDVYVNNFEEVNPGQSIVSFIDLSKFEVKAWISLEDLSKINDNTQYACLIDLGDNKIRVPGKIKEIGHKTSMSKQSYPISILIDAPENVNLRAGMTTHLEIMDSEATSPLGMQIPISCVFSKENKTCVWLFNESTNTVSSKEVQRGDIVDDDMIQIQKGLRGGENIVSSGVNFLSEGAKVKKYKGFSKTNIGNKL
jgi:RND family efflux transporter MFP subunit